MAQVAEAEYREKYLSKETQTLIAVLPCYDDSRIREQGETGVLHCVGSNKCDKCSNPTLSEGKIIGLAR